MLAAHFHWRVRVVRYLRSIAATFAFVLVLSLASSVMAQQFPESTYQELRWRLIGPFRGGRTRALAGVPSQPNVFYIGVVNGGVWKSEHNLRRQRRRSRSPQSLRRRRYL